MESTQPIGYASVEHAGKVTLAAVAGAHVILLPQLGSSVSALIAAGPAGLVAASAIVAAALAGHAENGNGETADPPGPVLLNHADVRFRAPLDRFRRDLLCTGWNYWDHFEEGRGKREGQDVPKPVAPTFFTKGPDAVLGPFDDIAYDARLSAKWDYEAELVVIIGRAGRSIPAAQAMQHVWGYCLANDISQRDLQRRHGGQWLKGKSIDQSMPLGPWVVPAADLDPTSVQLQCIVNGRTLQDASVLQMAFPIAELIAELSFGMTLQPGDVLLTGTPAGVGNAREPQIFLQAGDEVIVRGTGLGELRNRLVETDLVGASSVVLAAATA